MIKIDKKITGYAVVTSPKPKPDTAPDTAPVHDRLPRPETLYGETYKIKTPLNETALYVTINDIQIDGVRYPFEIFINSKAVEHYQWIAALTLVISAVFRKGGDCGFLIEELRSVFDPKGGYFKKGGKYMPSLVAEIGDVIERHLYDIGAVKRDSSLATAAKAMLAEKSGQNGFPDTAVLCDKCNQIAVVMMDGCMTCLNCGNSRCS